MDYNFITLNTRDFEHLVQALTQKLLGNNSIVFGDGPDGARELTYRGKSNFPNANETWEGYWIVQAKYKARKFDTEDDFNWIKKNFVSEMSKFQEKKRKIETPKNYLFFTNAKLTPVQTSGGRDKIEDLKKQYTRSIPNIYIASYDELCKLLDNNRDVATTYSSFILAGDILAKLYNLLDYEEKKKQNTQNIILTYLEKSFNADLYSKLIQAGDLTNQINIEKVFIDIDVINIKRQDIRIKFLNQLIQFGNLKWTPEKSCKLVLVGGAGSGKSTLSQFASQIYSAFFVSDNRKDKTNEKIKSFISDFNVCTKPNCLRFPFKIVLKDFATWIKEQSEKRQSKTVLNFIKYRLETIGDGVIEIDTLREFLSKISSLFIFDGLDEVPITSNRNDVLKEINDFIEIELKIQNADAVILCTTRQQGYTKEFDENTFQHFVVSELSDDDCMNYLDKLLTNIETSYDDRQNYLKTLQDAIKDSVTGRLMRTPLQATIMTILVKSGGKPSRNKYNLFKEYYDTIYKRELQKELLPILKDYKRNIDDIHALLGFELQVKSEGRENPSALFESNEFQSLIRMYLKEKEEWQEKEIDSFITKITNAVTERLVFIGEIQDNKIGFIIRSLQEYFAANYIINYRDELVIENIKDIANSSYWRNTFLFAVSGLHNTKNHLIDQVYLHCERLNGNEEAPNIPSIYNTIFFGSWLALEILSEGIFSDSPRNRNRFVRLLDKLFLSTNTGDLNKIEYLPYETVTELIIQKYLNEVLISERGYIEKYASFKLAFSLIKNHNLNSYVYELLNKSWNEEYEVDLINLMYKLKISDTNFFFEKLYNAILKDNYLLYTNLFKADFDDEYKISRYLIKQFKRNDLFLSRLIELLFVTTLNHFFKHKKEYNIFTLFNEIIGKECFNLQKSFTWGILDVDNKTEEIEIVKGYSLSIISINSEDLNLDYFSELFEKYSLEYLASFIQFIKNPNILTLSSLLNHLKIRNNNDIFKSVINSSRNLLFTEISSVVNDISQIDDLIQRVNNKEFGDYSDWLLLENKIKKDFDYTLLFKYAASTTRSADTESEIVNNFYSKFYDELQKDNTNVFQIEFIKLFSWSFDDNFGSDLTYNPSISIIETVLKIFNSIDINSLNYRQLYNLRSGIIALIFNIKPNEIEKINVDLFSLFNYNIFNHRYRYSREIYSKVLEHCIAYNNYKQNNIEQLILFLNHSLNEITIEDTKKICFRRKEIEKGESSYKIILRLISFQFNTADIDLIIQKLDQQPEPNSIYWVVTKLFLNLKINENWCIDLFVKIYNKLIKQKDIDINIIENIELYLKFVNESKMTNMKKMQLTYNMR
ncbi:MAG: hypothetical protein H6567_07740 [Lewinellaceae bacterium]|nr:hypothetical protein [Lewinellaceae bacterium]